MARDNELGGNKKEEENREQEEDLEGILTP